MYAIVAQPPKRATSIANTSAPGSPSTIQLATESPTPPPWENPAITPQATQNPSRPRTGPMRGLPSGAKVNGPFTTCLMPASRNAGKCSKPTASEGAIRSMSSGSSSWPKSHGVSWTDQGTHAFS